MDVADSMEVTADSIIIPAPPETVSTVSSSQCSSSFGNDLDPTKASKANVVEQLQRQITLLELKLADHEEKLTEMEKEHEILLGRQFSLDKIKDNSAILFDNGFPCYEALISVFKYLEPKLAKMQYWKGEHLVRERQPYQEDEKNKPGPSRKLTFLDEILLVLMRLKAGLFVQDLVDRFGASTSLVSRICITGSICCTLNSKTFSLFHHESWYAKTCQTSLPSFQQVELFWTVQKIFFQRPSAMLRSLKLGQTTSTTTLGTNWWESLQMAKSPFLETSGMGGCRINRYQEKVEF